MWRAGPALMSALLVVTVSIVWLVIVEWREQPTYDQLGHDGVSARAIVAPTDHFAGPAPWGERLADFGREWDLSIAYTRDYDSRVVRIIDPGGRFRTSGTTFTALLGERGPGALVSSAVGGADGSVKRRWSSLGVAVRGHFDPDVQFESNYPSLVLNAPEYPFVEGVYLFAGGAHLSEPDLERDVQLLFESNGLEVRHYDRGLSTTMGGVILDVAVSPYGVILMLVGVLGIACHFIVLAIYAAIRQQRLSSAVMVGADYGQLVSMATLQLLKPTAIGLGAGTGVALGVITLIQELALAAVQTQLAGVPIAVAVAGSVSAALCLAVATIQGREIYRAVLD